MLDICRGSQILETFERHLKGLYVRYIVGILFH